MMETYVNTPNGCKQATAAIRRRLKGCSWSDIEVAAVSVGLTPQTLYSVQKGETKTMRNGTLARAAHLFDIEIREPKKRGRPRNGGKVEQPKASLDDLLVDVVDRFWATRRQMDELEQALKVYLAACAQ
jgi:hypothetical protein